MYNTGVPPDFSNKKYFIFKSIIMTSKVYFLSKKSISGSLHGRNLSERTFSGEDCFLRGPFPWRLFPWRLFLRGLFPWGLFPWRLFPWGPFPERTSVMETFQKIKINKSL